MVNIENITFSYSRKKRPVLENFSLNMGEGKVCGLLGKNGAGKSTLLYLIAGLLNPNSGKVLYHGIDTRQRRPQTLNDMFIVPEEFDLPKVHLMDYIKNNSVFYPKFSLDDMNRYLTTFEMDSDVNLGQLSMGQKKKVFMCFALATNVSLLLMDEPTNGLDIPSKSQFRKVIANNMTDERMLIISTHQVHDIESLLDHIVILNQNNLLLDASVADICEDYSFEYRTPAEMDDTVLYAEPTLQGNAVIAKRKAGSRETQMNLELLFNAAINGKL